MSCPSFPPFVRHLSVCTHRGGNNCYLHLCAISRGSRPESNVPVCLGRRWEGKRIESDGPEWPSSAKFVSRHDRDRPDCGHVTMLQIIRHFVRHGSIVLESGGDGGDGGKAMGNYAICPPQLGLCNGPPIAKSLNSALRWAT